ncbi:helix-turn-helix domain-containing protein [Leuconostocaceae bacterium ESL0723]|nr:helix-turn-helix domain-containing protein [Leuconostocaceae bacterium ESL0723]
MVMYSVTKKRWDAITHHDGQYDGQFIYGVRGDMQVCKPSCQRHQHLARGDIKIFKNPDEALLDGYTPCPDCFPFGKLSPRDQLVYEVKSYIAKHYDQRLTLEQLSEHFHVSPGVLHRSSLLVTKQTPQNYLLEVRMTKAQEMLREGKLSVAMIALKVGIPNVSYFNTVFKQQVGMTAAQYRKKFN